MSGTKELRLAVVCYGGVSLAVYMHGITRELHNLVLASRAYEREREVNPFTEGTTQHAYWRLLAGVEETYGIHLRVVIDVIAGTSAGGINGIFLAKALSRDLSQAALRDLWLERADIKQLAGGKVSILGKLTQAAAAALLPKVKSRPPLRGNDMIEWLFEALCAMEASTANGAEREAEETLVPPGQDLDLFVTTTDQPGFRREIATDVPPLVAERRHRHVMHFSHRRGEFAPRFDSALTFSARATSSFPGAFPQVSARSLVALLKGRFGPGRVEDFLAPAFRQQHDFFSQYRVEDADPGATVFVDGGVLDNYPFGKVIETIGRRRASREVDRRLIYVQPDPRNNLTSAVENPDGKSGEKGLFGTAIDGLSSLPSYEPIVDDMLRLFGHNDLSERLGEIVAQNEKDVTDLVEQALAGAGVDVAGDWLAQLAPAGDPDGGRQRIARLREEIEGALGRITNLGYRPYVQARAHAVIDQFVLDINRLLGFTEGSTPALGVNTMIRDWAARRHWIGGAATPADQRDLLEAFDLGHLRRRIVFVVQAVNGMYATAGSGDVPQREQLDAAKARLYEVLDRLEGIIEGEGLSASLQQGLAKIFKRQDIIGGIRAAEGEPLSVVAARLLDDRITDLDAMAAQLADYVAAERAAVRLDLFSAFAEITADWSAVTRRQVLARYLGFPFWDLLIYPVVAYGAVDRLDRVEIVRFSPQEEQSLAPPGWDGHLENLVPAKVKGVGAAHFKAFLKREYRENDYLWGRLDGAAGVIDLVLDSGAAHAAPGGGRAAAAAELAASVRTAGQRAALDEEEPAFTTKPARRLVSALRAQLS